MTHRRIPTSRTTRPRRRQQGTRLLAAGVAAGLVILPTASFLGAPQDLPSAPLETGIEETVEVSLVLLDVEVLDASGNPMPGLSAADFSVRVGPGEWPIYSVDDFCRCCGPEALIAATTETSTPTPESGEPVVRTETPTPGAGDSPTRPRFVLYFDFSQIPTAVRRAVRNKSKTWIETRMRPGDEAIIVAHAFDAGVKTLTELTSDRDELLAGVDAAFEAPEFVDVYADQLAFRIEGCNRCVEQCVETGMRDCARGCCLADAMSDVRHGKESLASLDRFMAGLEAIPGRKAVILFAQGGTLFPARFYGPLHTDRSDLAAEVGDLLRPAREAGASAVASRASLHVATLPTGWRLQRLHPGYAALKDEESQNLGSNLAEYTGGTYSHPGHDIDDVLASAGRECCLYRIALRAPAKPSQRIHRVRVEVRGRTLPRRYGVRFMTTAERWMRRASGYLARPGAVADLPLQAALVPVASASRRNRWNLSVQVSFPADTLMLTPLNGRHQGRWRLAAFINREDDGKSWKLLTDSQLRVGDPVAGLPSILHSHTLEKLKPGRYRLAAVVEDRNSGLFGAVETSLRVTDRETRPTTVGPIFLRPQRHVVKLDLPIIGKKDKVSEYRADNAAGMLPVDLAVVSRGAKLYVATWVCPDRSERSDDEVDTAHAWPEFLGWLSREGMPRYRLPALVPVPSGACLRVEDMIDTNDLEPGVYTYHLQSAPDPEAVADPDGESEIDIDLLSRFTVIPAPGT